MATIAVDIDSTLYDFETPAREGFAALAQKYDDPSLIRGTYVPWTEWRSPSDVCGLEKWLEVIALCHDDDMILSQQPYAGSVETCQALVNEGHSLIYLSARAEGSAQATIEWLANEGFLETDGPSSATDVLCVSGDKRPYLRDCQYLIDDRPKTVVEFVYDYDWERKRIAYAQEEFLLTCPESDWPEFDAEHKAIHGRKAFVVAYPYNQSFTDVPGTYLAPTWAGINSYLARKGVLSKVAYQPLGV